MHDSRTTAPPQVQDPFGAPAESRPARTVWFHRSHGRLYGGHIKHSHYFGHVVRMTGFRPKISFSGEEQPDDPSARECRRLWPDAGTAVAGSWDPAPDDVLFLAGADWGYLNERRLETLPNPRINLIQHVRHAQENTAPRLYRYLGERAVRICVSQEVADAITATGRVNGPVLVIPNGIDMTPFAPTGSGSPADFDRRRQRITIAGYKSPNLARALSAKLGAEGIEHRLVLDFRDRSEFLRLLRESRIAVCLPRAEEGFYLPALEAMAAGCIVVTTDCIGNRGFCRHGTNSLIAERTLESLLRTLRRAVAMSAMERAHLHRHGRDMALEHSLERERSRFHAILRDIDRLWRTG